MEAPPEESNVHHEAIAAKWSNDSATFRGAFTPATANQQRTPHSNSMGRNCKERNKVKMNDYYVGHPKVMQMHSAVYSLLLLQNDENYLIASEKNGVIQQWDRRMNGVVRTYEGHENTQTHSRLGSDPTETLLVSGGEDFVVRIWSLASGRLLHAQRTISRPAGCICWPTSMRLRSQGGYWEEPPFESNFSWGFWFGSPEGLQYMHAHMCKT